jgi:hypothetical protein
MFALGFKASSCPIGLCYSSWRCIESQRKRQMLLCWGCPNLLLFWIIDRMCLSAGPLTFLLPVIIRFCSSSLYDSIRSLHSCVCALCVGAAFVLCVGGMGSLVAFACVHRGAFDDAFEIRAMGHGRVLLDLARFDLMSSGWGVAAVHRKRCVEEPVRHICKQ